MARWKLTQPHYLNVPGTKWEYTENSRINGRPIRKQYDVPLYLHPDDPGQWTHIHNKDEGEICVCWAGKGEPRDITFTGSPTPDMTPLDDEAKAISSQLKVGPNFAEEIPEGGYAGLVLENLSRQLAEAMVVNTAPASSAGMDKLLAAMTKMMEQNAQLIQTLGEAKARRP